MKNTSELPSHPVNYLMGRLLQHLRHERGIRNATAVARHLELSPSTYRLIEAGRQPIPSYCALRIAELFELPVKRVAAALALAGSLADTKIDYGTLRARCHALAVLDQSFSWVGPMIEHWRTIERGAASESRRMASEASILIRIVDALRGPPSDTTEAGIDASMSSAIAGLSPFHLDALAEWIDRESLVTPALRMDRLLQWLTERASRVIGIRAFVTDPEGVRPILEREAMVLELVRNPHEPRLRIAFDAAHADRVERDIRAALRAAADRHPLLDARSRAHRRRSVGENVAIRPADARFEAALAPIRNARLPGNAATLSADRHARQFRDVWIVDYRANDRQGSVRRVGFLCLYERIDGAESPRTGYAVALDAHIADDCVARFDTAWTALPK